MLLFDRTIGGMLHNTDTNKKGDHMNDKHDGYTPNQQTKSIVQQILPALAMQKLLNSSNGNGNDAHRRPKINTTEDAISVEDNDDDDESNTRRKTGPEDNEKTKEDDNGDNNAVRRSVRNGVRRIRGGGGGRGGGGVSSDLTQLMFVDMFTRFAPVFGAAFIKGATTLGKRILLRKRGGNLLYENIVRYAGHTHEKTGSIYLSSTSDAKSGDKDGNNNRGGGGNGSGCIGNDSMFEAVLAYATDLPEARVIHHDSSNGGSRFVIETDEMIPLGDDVYFRRVIGGSGASDSKDKMTVEVFSFVKDIVQLRSYLTEMESHYRSAKNNQLGRQLFFFDEIVTVPPMMNVGSTTEPTKPDLTRLPAHPTFTMSALHTTKTLKNVFGTCMQPVRRRVDFFVNNRSWYEEKGVPYTLGFLMHGAPGCGKTSFIKGLAKHTGRHIVNVRLSDFTTSAQLSNLLHSGVINAVHNGRASPFEIPIDRILLVMEDIDCLSDIVLDRGLRERERERGKHDKNTSSSRKGKGTNKTKTKTKTKKELRREEKTRKEDEVLKSVHLGTRLASLLEALKGKRTMDAFSIAHDMDNHRKMLLEDDRHPAGGGGRIGSATLHAQQQQSNSSRDPSDALKLNLSVLLNLLDGVLETPGRMMVMTSNYPERLDRALIRPGRIDSIVHFTKCNAEDIAEIVLALTGAQVSDEFVERLPDGVWTPAQVSQVVFERMELPVETTLEYLCHKNNACCVFDVEEDDDEEDDDEEEKEESKDDDDSDDSDDPDDAVQPKQPEFVDESEASDSSDKGEDDQGVEGKETGTGTDKDTSESLPHIVRDLIDLKWKNINKSRAPVMNHDIRGQSRLTGNEASTSGTIAPIPCSASTDGFSIFEGDEQGGNEEERGYRPFSTDNKLRYSNLLE
jgi:SpoVK/Ycf46/Vps4 family AAA+-type ATPase